MLSFLRRLRSGLDLGAVTATWLVVGLGNPGKKYAATRHNVGFRAVDKLASSWQPIVGVNALGAQAGDALLLKPQTFMNRSGDAVAPIAEKLGVPLERILVVHDELDIAEGALKLKRGGNENGHNGLKSITARVGSRDYPRLRIGIGRPDTALSIPDYVLGAPDGGDDATMDAAAEAIRMVVDHGFDKAQTTVNSRR